MHCAETRARISIILRSRRPPPSPALSPFAPRAAIFTGKDFLADGSPLLSGCYPLLSSLHAPCTRSFMCTRYMERHLLESEPSRSSPRPHVCPGLAGGDLTRQPIPYPRQSAAGEAPTGPRLRFNRNPMRAAAVILVPMQSRCAASTATRKNDRARVIARSLHRGHR